MASSAEGPVPPLPRPIAQARSWLLRTLACRRLRVAYSGGMDSHVLLHLLARTAPEAPWELDAIHVNHNLAPQSRAWAAHCREVCHSLGVRIRILDIDAAAPRGASPESWARAQRYQALEALMEAGDVLATAHHQEDQVETLLLRLLRGAGVKGLAAMAPLRPLGQGRHARPLLDCPQGALSAYAQAHELDWVQDPSNAERRFDRNFLRHEVLPVLRQRWPGLARPAARSARLHAEAQDLLDELARADAATCAAPEAGVLLLAPLRQLSPPRRKNLLRREFEALGLPLPGEKQLARLNDDLVERPGPGGCVSWQGAEARRHGGKLYLAAPLDAAFDGAAAQPWDFPGPCKLQDGELRVAPAQGPGPGRALALKQALCHGAAVEARYRAGGEALRLPGREGRRKLKDLLREAGIPPWRRGRVPLVYVNGELALVVGVCVAAEFAAAPGEPSWVVSWTPGG